MSEQENLNRLLAIQVKEDLIKMLKRESNLFPSFSAKKSGIDHCIRLIHETTRADSNSIKGN